VGSKISEEFAFTLFMVAVSSLMMQVTREVTSYEGCPENIHPFGYLEKSSRGLDVTWQPFRGELTVHP